MGAATLVGNPGVYTVLITVTGAAGGNNHWTLEALFAALFLWVGRWGLAGGRAGVQARQESRAGGGREAGGR